jgi:hypothetical protein
VLVWSPFQYLDELEDRVRERRPGVKLQSVEAVTSPLCMVGQGCWIDADVANASAEDILKWSSDCLRDDFPNWLIRFA